MHLTSLVAGILLASLPSINGARSSKADSAILLSKVKTLTLYGDKQTSHRRVTPIPQLNCVGGNGCNHYDVDVMRCTNAGSEYDAEDVQWTCSANLPSDFKLGSTEVICEGYDNADDPWVLKGSCGVEYRLLLTDEGEKKFGANSKSTKSKSARKSKPAQDNNDRIYQTDQPKSTLGALWTFLFWAVFISVLCLIVYRIFNPVEDGRGPAARRNQRRWGGGGGGNDDGTDDPPPPYSPNAPPYQPRSKPSNSFFDSSSGGARSGPGFWSGAATGGAAGYGAGYYQGSRNADRQRQQDRASSSWFSGGSSGSGSGGGGFGGGSSSAGPSSSRHDSSGFGGTRRR